MSANQDRASVNAQGIVFDQAVVYDGQEYLADQNIAGCYHPFGESSGRQLLMYCVRCSDRERENCLGDQLMLVEYFYLKDKHFVS